MMQDQDFYDAKYKIGMLNLEFAISVIFIFLNQSPKFSVRTFCVRNFLNMRTIESKHY